MTKNETNSARPRGTASAIALLAVVAGCSSSSSPVTTSTADAGSSPTSAVDSGAPAPGIDAGARGPVTGTVGNEVFVPATTLFAGGKDGRFHIVFSTRAALCTNMGDANEKELDITLPATPTAGQSFTFTANADSSTQPFAAYGIYGKGTETDFDVESGTLTVATASGATVTGTLTFTFGTGESATGDGSSPPGGSIAGSFEASACAAYAAQFL